MRLFVALNPPAEVIAEVEVALEPVRAVQPDLRWFPSERWHLTLAFFGDVPDASVAAVTERVARRLARRDGGTSFELRFAGVGQFARRALWVGVDGEVDSLRAIAEALSTERRPYRPHLSVARLRGNQDATTAVERLASFSGSRWRADSVHLVRSFLGPRPRYQTVASWPLTAPDTDG